MIKELPDGYSTSTFQRGFVGLYIMQIEHRISSK